MKQTTPIRRSACPHISRGLIGLFGRFVRMLPTLCLNPVLVSCKIKKIGTTLIAELMLFFSRVFRFRSSRESLIILLLERSGWGFRAITRGPHRSKPDSTRHTRGSTRTSPSLMMSPSIPYQPRRPWTMTRREMSWIRRNTEHDRILAVPDSDETEHPVCGLLVRTLSVFVAHVSSSRHQVDPQVPSFHTRVWSLVFGLLLSFSLRVFQCGLCWLSSWEEVHF
jgi:hypothetical protein